MPIDDVTTLYAERLQSFQPPLAFAIRPLELTPVGVTVCAATKSDVAALRDWRDRLSATFGFRHPDHDDYVFHVTFAYFVEWLPDEVIPDWNRYLLEARDQLQRETPILELTHPQFCTFETMEHFQPLMTLSG